MACPAQASACSMPRVEGLEPAGDSMDGIVDGLAQAMVHKTRLGVNLEVRSFDFSVHHPHGVQLTPPQTRCWLGLAMCT